jgi:hypothetical protein
MHHSSITAAVLRAQFQSDLRGIERTGTGLDSYNVPSQPTSNRPKLRSLQSITRPPDKENTMADSEAPAKAIQVKLVLLGESEAGFSTMVRVWTGIQARLTQSICEKLHVSVKGKACAACGANPYRPSVTVGPTSDGRRTEWTSWENGCDTVASAIQVSQDVAQSKEFRDCWIS